MPRSDHSLYRFITSHTRIVLALGLALLMAAPAVMIWANRVELKSSTGADLSAYEAHLEEAITRHLMGVQLPRAFASSPEFAPFGGPIKAEVLSGQHGRGMLLTNLGHVSWNVEEDALIGRVPPGLRAAKGVIKKTERGSLRPGLNYVQLSADAIASRGLEAVMTSVGSHGRIAGMLPDRTIILHVDANQMQSLRSNPDVERTRAFEPYNKIALDFGVRPQLNKNEANNPDIRASLTVVPGLDGPALRNRIANLPGVSELTALEFGSGYTLRINYKHLDKVAKLDRILHVAPIRDYMLSNTESPRTTQMGSAEDSLGLLPFTDAGVDGGGIADNGVCDTGAGVCTAPASQVGKSCSGDRDCDSPRVNNGEPAVPPQIVSVIDNGISYDSTSFSQTATEPTITASEIGFCDTATGLCVDGLVGEECGNDIDCDLDPVPLGPTHRKIHGVIPVLDNGTGCDAPLSGSGTHGNVVAGAIAAAPSELGSFLTKAGIGASGEARQARMDGIASGARILLSDVATPAVCTVNSLVERGGEVNPGNLLVRLNEVIANAQGDQIHVAVLPFGHPDNFSTEQFLLSNGTYNDSAVDIDTFAWNNRDFLVVMPVGNNGGLVGNNRLALAINIFPDFFNGTNLDDDGNNPVPLQTAAPSTAKNLLAVGGSTADCFTFFGTADCEGAITRYSSRGPASEQSLRMAPKITAPNFDQLGGTPAIDAGSVAVFRSSDNDNLAPVEAQLDEGNFGTSYASAYVSGLAAIVYDYFGQGFYPTGSRVDANRVSRISSSLALAAITASADFNEGGLNRRNEDTSERFVRRTRCLDVGTVATADVGIICNSEQGYGRAVGTNVLPLANWSNDFELHPVVTGNKTEYPAAGLLVWDGLSTGEPGLTNVLTSVSHTFLVDTPNALDLGGGSFVATTSNLRVSLAWLDRPGVAGSGGPLINDLDLVLQSPGPDNTLDNGGDDIYYIGNHYGPATDSSFLDQWSIASIGAPPALLTEKRNNTEGIHLTGDANGDAFKIATGAATPQESYGDSQIHTGTWRVTVQRGSGGAVPGSLTLDAVDEDTNGNGRLDPGEDTGSIPGFMETTIQEYALVIAGPVFRDPSDPPPLAGPAAAAFPAHSASFDRVRLDCATNVFLTIQDAFGNCSAAVAQGMTIFSVFDAGGNLVETEGNFLFAASGATCISESVPVRFADVPLANGILDVATGYTVVATYDDGVSAPVSASAPVNCDPDLINASFASATGKAFTQNQYAIGGGCDQDAHFDSGEVVTYGVALQNRSRTDDYADLIATLTPTGGATGAIRVLDSPKNMGRMPGTFATGAFFHIFVDPAGIPLNPIDRWVELTLNLDSLSNSVRIAQHGYTYRHALDSDWETLHYSTDHPDGGREIRDLTRNLVVDPVNALTETRERNLNAFLQFLVPNEDITFSSMFVVDPSTGVVNNILGEDLNNNSTLDAGEDKIPDNVLNRGILLDGNPATPQLDRVPWTLDRNDGGWVAFRHAGGNPTGLPTASVWEYQHDRPICGFQTAGNGVCDTGTGQCSAPDNRIGDACTVDTDCDSFGIWKTGDGDPATPTDIATACDNHIQPSDPATPPLVEFAVDVLESPIIAKVNQGIDNRGFPYIVEFQRWGLNLNIQILDGYAGGGFTIDNDIDSDNTNCLLCGQIDQYYTRRFGGFDKSVFRLAGQYFPGSGINPGSTDPPQRTFGVFRDNGTLGVIDGQDCGFSGVSAGGAFSTPGTCDTFAGICTMPPENAGSSCTQDSDCDSGHILQAEPDYLPFPPPNPQGGPPTPVPGVCDGGSSPGSPCQVDPGCPGGGTCTLAFNTCAGPSRNFDTSLIEFEGGWSSPINNCVGGSCPEFFFFWTPGQASDRWQIGISSWAIESPGGETDYGYAWDDAVFEWDESHPQHESFLGVTPACDRYGTGELAGGQCATLVVDRSGIYECDEAIEITVYDAKCIAVGAGATSPLGGACVTDVECGAGGDCTADEASVDVFFVTDSDSIPVSTDLYQVATPKLYKPFALPAVPGQPGLYRGNIVLSTTTNDQNHAFTIPGSDGAWTVYYEDVLCDGDRDSQYGEYDFANIDGDNVQERDGTVPCIAGLVNANCDTVAIPPVCTAGRVGMPCTQHSDCCDDNCPQIYNPQQQDDDWDGIGNLCDNCPGLPETDPRQIDPGFLPAGYCTLIGGQFRCLGSLRPCTASSDCPPYCNFINHTCTGGILGGNPCAAPSDCNPVAANQFANPNQDERDHDGVGDVCDFDDLDLDNRPNDIDLCPDVWGTEGMDAIGRDICGTFTAAGFGVTCNTALGLCEPATGCSRATGPCVGDQCQWGDPSNPDYNSCNSDDYNCSRACTSDADCECDGFDRDLDDVPDKDDNCVLTPNGILQSSFQGVGNQTDSDGDGIGDACDGDCTGSVVVGRCQNAGVDEFRDELFCPPRDAPYEYADCDPGTGHRRIPKVDWDLDPVCVPYTYHPQNGGSLCSTVNDDWDVDFVPDNVDLCPALSDPIIIPGTLRQQDSDSDGYGDRCDPPGTFDDQFDGIPDDVVGFHGSIDCQILPLADMTILRARYQDLDGDNDIFPDTGETGRIELDIRNDGITLNDATILLQSDDPDVECISEPAVLVGTIPAGQEITVGSTGAGPPGFTFTASNLLNYTGPPQAIPTVEFDITVIANETLGIIRPTAFSLPADLEAAGGPHTFTAGPNGIPEGGTNDDGITEENFDVDKDQSGVFNVSDTWMVASATLAPGCPNFLSSDCSYHGTCSTEPSVACDPTAPTGIGTGNCELGLCVGSICTAPAQNAGDDCTVNDDCTGTPVCYAGRYLRGTLFTPGLNQIGAVSCGGFDDPLINNPVCDLDPDLPMDWHFHCPAGATNCPNSDSGNFNGDCVGGCSYDTPTDEYAEHAISLPNSLHAGAHFRPDNSQIGDTTHLRSLMAYQSAPMNLALFPRPGDLILSMKHLARLMDNNGVGGGVNDSQCADCADVQIRFDTNDDPDIDAWGFWDKLVPFQSVYDKKGLAWSAFGSYYCLFTPTDTGNTPPNPRDIHETMCFPLGLWSRCGSTTASTLDATGDCGGTGIIESDGRGVWVETKFNLAGFLGQRIEIRWVMESWVFDAVSSSYYEIGVGWDSTTADDGWWLDDIIVFGTVEQQVTPAPDTRDPACAPGPCGLCRDAFLVPTPISNCDSSIDDHGTVAVLKITDLDGNVLAGSYPFATKGESIRVSAVDSQITGGCVDGSIEFQFFEGDRLVQDWSPKPFYMAAPPLPVTNDGHHPGFGVRVRCSTDFSCTGAHIVSIDVPVYDGAGCDTVLGEMSGSFDHSAGVIYDFASGETCVRAWSSGNGKPTREFDYLFGSIEAMGKGFRVSPDGRLMLLGSDNLDTLPLNSSDWDGAHCIAERPGNPSLNGLNSMFCWGGGYPDQGICSTGSLALPLQGGICDTALGECTIANAGSPCRVNDHCETQLEGTLCTSDGDCGTGTCQLNPPLGEAWYYLAAAHARENQAQQLCTARLADGSEIPRYPTDGNYDHLDLCRDPWNLGRSNGALGYCVGGVNPGKLCNLVGKGQPDGTRCPGDPALSIPDGECAQSCAYCD